MGRNNESQNKAKNKVSQKLKTNSENGLKYNFLLMGKPSYDIFVDDNLWL